MFKEETTMKHLKKTFLSVLLAVAMVITCFSLLCSCGEQAPKMSVDPSTDASHGPTQSSGPAESNIPTQSTAPTQISTPTQSGNETPGGPGTSVEVSSPFNAHCEIQSEFSTEDAYVSVEFSFGIAEGCGFGSSRYTEVIVYMKHIDGEDCIIRRFDSKKLEQPEYAVKRVWDENHNHIIDYEYSHTETIDIPLSMFSGDSGRVWIGFHACTYHGLEQHIIGDSGGVWLYYEYNEATNSIRIVKIIEYN
jgi:hypothetical protein